MNIERREYKRYKLEHKIICRTSSNPRKKIVAKSYDLSISGIGLALKHIIKKGDEVFLQICGPFMSPPINAKGKIVWQGEQSRIAGNRAGIQFTEVPWTQLKFLVNSLSD
jgi:c-di-GMP-binding flagellar brake protein YcgR